MGHLVAIVGRPNVGKSALFNRIAGSRIAIVHNEPGVTRDRISATVEWQGHDFELVDTGGIGLLQGERSSDPITEAALLQVRLAIEAAQVVLFTVDAKEGLMPLDYEIADDLRQAGKQVLLVINKVDNPERAMVESDFLTLGFESTFLVSAAHDIGIHPLVKATVDRLPPEDAQPQTENAEGPLPAAGGSPHTLFKLAVVGRPNVGKSSLINALIRSDRVLVHETPGTTRDAVDVPLTVETEGRREHFVLIDTAGLRKRNRVDNSIEFFSAKRAEGSIARADLVLFVLDAEDGISEQDKKIGDLIVSHRKACVIVINKWDLVEPKLAEARKAARDKQQRRRGHGDAQDTPMLTLAEFGEWVQEQLFFLSYAPVIFSSAHTGLHLDRLLEAIRYVQTQWQQTVSTALLNRVLHEAIEQQQPVSTTGQRLKFYYATQKRTAPPTFLLFVNRDELLSEAYTKYLTRQLRQAFGFEGCPILLIPKARPRSVEPIREEPAKQSRPATKRRSPAPRHKAKRGASSRRSPKQRSSSRDKTKRKRK